MASNVIDTPTVQALYSYKGAHNDELTFKKGDIITLTQKIEGGWWEGTLGDTTGWFPANYVKEHNEPVHTLRGLEDSQECRFIVAKDLHDSEKAHVTELQGLLTNFLCPLECSDIINADEYHQLTGNFTEVLSIHERLLAELQKPTSADCLYSDRIGRAFLEIAPQFKSAHMTYCTNHPRAVVIIDKYKDELNNFMERSGAASPGVLVLITGLSKPFRRLHKYSAMLQELERHMELSHPDRGDTQRGIAVYKDIDSICSATRKQKELQLQVLTGPVRGWQGQPVSSLGEISHMSCVNVGADLKDRFLVLFPTTLLILSVSQRMSAFIYEGKLPLAGIVVKRLDDADSIKNAFEIQGPLIEKIVAKCKTSSEADKWVELLSKRASPSKSMSSASSTTAVTPKPPHIPLNSLSNMGRGLVPVAPSVLPMHHKRSHSFNHHQSYTQHTSSKSSTNNHNVNGTWKMTCLRPAPPACLTSASNQFSKCSYEEDALILRLIEAYCSPSANTRNTLSTAVDLDKTLDGNINIRTYFSNPNHNQCFNTSDKFAQCHGLNKLTQKTTNIPERNLNNAVRFSPPPMFCVREPHKKYRNPVHKSNSVLYVRGLKKRIESFHRSNPILNEIGTAYNFDKNYNLSLDKYDAYSNKRASSWCCGSFVKKQLWKTRHYD